MSMNETAGPRPFIPALAKVYAPLAPYGFAFIRIVIGLFIARHGYPKLFEGGTAGLAAGILPKLGLQPALGWAYLVGLTEFVGGIMLAFGFLTRFAAAALVIEFCGDRLRDQMGERFLRVLRQRRSSPVLPA